MLLSRDELKTKIDEIRRRAVTPEETAAEARLLRHRLRERLEVAEIRIGELRANYSKDERHIADAVSETQAALLKEIPRVRAELQVSTRPAKDFADELTAFVERILQEYNSGIDVAEKAKNMAEAKYFRDQRGGARRASGLLKDELNSMPTLWEGDRKSCAEQRMTTRESEVLSLLRSQEDARNEEIESEKRRRLNAVAGQIQDRRAANAAAGILTDEVAKPGQY